MPSIQGLDIPTLGIPALLSVGRVRGGSTWGLSVLLCQGLGSRRGLLACVSSRRCSWVFLVDSLAEVFIDRILRIVLP